MPALVVEAPIGAREPEAFGEEFLPVILVGRLHERLRRPTDDVVITDHVMDRQGEFLAAFVEYLPLLTDAIHPDVERVEDQVASGQHEVRRRGEAVDGPQALTETFRGAEFRLHVDVGQEGEVERVWLRRGGEGWYRHSGQQAGAEEATAVHAHLRRG